ncbi:MAG TPA: hypothetical protein VKA44_00410, partial [Gemmatimonadota bacterium]|nr:hypothetical protein [Gemmatimonadota bacterium]
MRIASAVRRSGSTGPALSASLALLASALLAGLPRPAAAQGRAGPAATATVDTAFYAALRWRNIGPFRGGRSAAV